MTIQWTALGTTRKGRQRRQNQDQFMVSPCKRGQGSLSGRVVGSDTQLVAVADGMGGHRGGSVAASFAVRSLREQTEDLLHKAALGLELTSDLQTVLEKIHQGLVAAGERDSRFFGMGTTLTAALIHQDQLWVAHVGDSRAYLIRDGQARQLTRDHTLRELVGHAERGNQHVLWNCLGGHLPRNVEVDVSEWILQPQDQILLCTDGLTDDLDDHEIARILEGYAADHAAQLLVSMAAERGGKDDITMVLCEGIGTTRVDTDAVWPADDSTVWPHNWVC